MRKPVKKRRAAGPAQMALLKEVAGAIRIAALEACTAESAAAQFVGDKAGMFGANRCWHRIANIDVDTAVASALKGRR